MTAKDVAFVMLFFLFILSIIGNVLLLPSYLESDYAERDLRQRIANLENEKNRIFYDHQHDIDELEDENQDLEEEIETLESIVAQLKSELESRSGTTFSYEALIDSLRERIYELEAENLQFQQELDECRSERAYRSGHCYWCDPCPHCCPCYGYPPYGCQQSVSVSNVPGFFGGQAYDAVIYVYFYSNCYVLRIYVDILDLNTLQIVGVDWD